MSLKKFAANYGGIIAGALYALAMRLLFNDKFDFVSLFSISFVWIVPIVIGIVPLLFASSKQISSTMYTVTAPVISVLLFFIICFITRIEDIICIIIISIPFLFCAAVSGAIFGNYVIKRRQRKGIMYCLLLMPFISSYAESNTTTPLQTFEIKTKTIINAQPQNIWPNVVRVRKMHSNEFESSFFNYAGIPKPLYAELNRDTIGATRIGHFEEGLLFKETVTGWDRLKRVDFDITVVPSSIRNTVFDQHILKGNHFSFVNASYEIHQINSNQCVLILSSSYRLNTSINAYASWWGNLLLTDFQERLLSVIKKRCDTKV